MSLKKTPGSTRPLLWQCTAGARRCGVVLSALLLAACAQPAATPTTAETRATAASAADAFRAGILIFGDGGYQLKYPDQDDYVDLFTPEQYLEDEWNNWLADKRPPDEYRPRLSALSPVTNRIVPATGMALTSTAMKLP